MISQDTKTSAASRDFSFIFESRSDDDLKSYILTVSRNPDFLPFQLLSGEVIEAMKSQTCENIFPLHVETRTRIQRRARRSETLKCKLICSGWERNQIKMMV